MLRRLRKLYVFASVCYALKSLEPSWGGGGVLKQ